MTVWISKEEKKNPIITGRWRSVVICWMINTNTSRIPTRSHVHAASSKRGASFLPCVLRRPCVRVKAGQQSCCSSSTEWIGGAKSFTPCFWKTATMMAVIHFCFFFFFHFLSCYHLVTPTVQQLPSTHAHAPLTHKPCTDCPSTFLYTKSQLYST